MKRLGVILCVLGLTASLFGGFFTPKPASAALEEKDKLSTLSSFNAADVLPQTVPGYSSGGFPNINQKYKDKLEEIVQKNFDLLKSDSSKNATDLRSRSLTEFNLYLDDRLKEIPNELLSVNGVSLVAETRYEEKYLQILKTNIVAAVSLVTNTKREELGMITEDEKLASNKQISATQNAALQAQVDKNKKPDTCSFGLVGAMNLGACISEGVEWLIRNTLLEIAGFLLWLTANMFNYAVQVGILQFSTWAPDSLYPIWVIVRQIVSLLIVFVGLYLGFMYILGRDEKFQKYIPWVIIFALFVNFSYPLARTAIDISNIVSLNIYASAVGSNALTSTEITSRNSAGSLIMNRLGLQGLVASAVNDKTNTTSKASDIKGVPGLLLTVLFVLYSAYIFLMATGIMVMRTASLIFLTIASPILLVDSVLPLLGDKAKEIRKVFFEQLAVGPVFMLMLALTMKFLEVFSQSKRLTTSAITGNVGDQTIVTFFNIAMMLIMLHIMITVTKKVSGSVGEFATNAVGKVGGFGLGVATGGAGFLARQSIGRGAAHLAREGGALDRWQSKTGAAGFIGRRMYDMTSSVSNNTFDARNSSYVKAKTDKLGMGMGMGAKLGYSGAQEDKEKKAAERGNRIKTKFERTGVGADGKWHRKGDVDEDAIARKNEYFTNGGGALFLTKESKLKLADGVVDEEATKFFDTYKKTETRAGKTAFLDENKRKLDELKKKDPDGLDPKTRALSQAVMDAEKEAKEYTENFNRELAKATEEINLRNEEKKKHEYFLRQTKDIRDALVSSGVYSPAILAVLPASGVAPIAPVVSPTPASVTAPVTPSTIPVTVPTTPISPPSLTVAPALLRTPNLNTGSLSLTPKEPVFPAFGTPANAGTFLTGDIKTISFAERAKAKRAAVASAPQNIVPTQAESKPATS